MTVKEFIRYLKKYSKSQGMKIRVEGKEYDISGYIDASLCLNEIYLEGVR